MNRRNRLREETREPAKCHGRAGSPPDIEDRIAAHAQRIERELASLRRPPVVPDARPRLRCPEEEAIRGKAERYLACNGRTLGLKALAVQVGVEYPRLHALLLESARFVLSRRGKGQKCVVVSLR